MVVSHRRHESQKVTLRCSSKIRLLTTEDFRKGPHSVCKSSEGGFKEPQEARVE